jgi:hypothetical protein
MKTLQKLHLQRLLILAGVVSIWGSFPMLLLAETHQLTTSNTSQFKIDFNPVQKVLPPDRGTPPAEEGTGSRGDCLYAQNTPPLTRLVGSSNLKFTTEKHPVIWIYIPYTSAQIEQAEFSLQNGDLEVYRGRFKLNSIPGVVGIKLPAELPALEVGQEYRWYLDIDCFGAVSSSATSAPASLTGLIERVSVSPQLQQELNTAKTPLEKIRIYAKSGIWVEALTQLAQLRLQEPENPQLRQIWMELLSGEKVGLSRIAEEPISGTITANSLLK